MTKILRIDHSPYTLHAKQILNSKSHVVERHGALLRFLFKNIGFGYADCHPLEEFGDAPLHEHLTLLEQKKFTFLTKRSLHFATLDATCRNDRRSIFANVLPLENREDQTGSTRLSFPKNHFTSSTLLKKEEILALKADGFSKFKFKFGKHTANEICYMKDHANFFADHNIQIRIDFNGNIKNLKTLESLKDHNNAIEFIEDPFPAVNAEYAEHLQHYSQYYMFALDFIVPSEDEKHLEKFFAYKIVKPAREGQIRAVSSRNLTVSSRGLTAGSNAQKLVYTSSMDHPLGQICALFDAAYQNTTEHCGLITHTLFEPNPYSEQLKVEETRLLPVEGTGFGFDHLLKMEKWKSCF